MKLLSVPTKSYRRCSNIKVEGELVACAKKVLQVYDDSGNVPCVFNYHYKDDVVFEAKLN